MSRKRLLILALFFSLATGALMSSQDKGTNTTEQRPQEIDVTGPNGISLRFIQPDDFLYRRAEVIHPGEAPVPIHLEPDSPSSTTLVDGVDARANNAIIVARLDKELP